MYKLFLLVKDKLGIDKAIAYSSGARIIQAFTGVISIFFIATFLSGEEQGFYYTFGSLLAMQVFFELGLTSIITQYVAHEAAHLKISINGTIEGDQKYRSRLASLIHFSAKWYGVIALLFLFIIIITGIIFFNKYYTNNSGINWLIPWVLICISSAIKLFQSPFSSILTGLGKVKEMSKIGFYQQIILPLSSWIGLFFGLKLYVVGISYLLSVLIWNVYILVTGQQKILLNLWKEKLTEKISYMKEIFPYQWRIALSWISGYFIFQLFNPVLFATEGAAVAGKMGMTLTVLNSIQALSLNWLNTKIPLYSRLIALKDYVQLDKIFNQTLKQMTTVCLILLSIMLMGICFLRTFKIGFGDNLLGDRFLDYIPMILMMIPIFINQFVSSWATYLRCHKQEPFLVNSICAGIACCLSTVILGKYFGLYGITIGYCMITLAFMPWGYWIYKTKKNEWHGK